MSLYIGLMSGTSMDGIDAALVELPGNQLLSGLTIP
jgi:anhydro-N-acetylmuramic acid kinase